MRPANVLYIIILVFMMNNCKNDDLIEEKVISDIFPQLAEKFDLHRTNLFPKPPPPAYDNDSNFIGIDSIKWEMQTKEDQNILNHIDSVDSRIMLGIYDSCFLINERFELNGANPEEKTVIKSKINIKKLNIQHINVGKDYELVNVSVLKKKYKNIWKISDRKFAGLIKISTINFDKEFNFGSFEFENYPFYHEGVGYTVYIEYINKKWRIKRIVRNWIT